MSAPRIAPELEALLLSHGEATDLAGRLGWLEAVANALDATQLGSQGKAAARDFRAALGAIVLYAQGPKDPADLVPLEATVRTFLARAQQATYGALAASYRELAQSAPPADRAECAAIAQAFTEIRDATVRGEPPPKKALDRLQMIGARRSP